MLSFDEVAHSTFGGHVPDDMLKKISEVLVEIYCLGMIDFCAVRSDGQGLQLLKSLIPEIRKTRCQPKP